MRNSHRRSIDIIPTIAPVMNSMVRSCQYCLNLKMVLPLSENK